jgi:hypothetical protein
MYGIERLYNRALESLRCCMDVIALDTLPLDRTEHSNPINIRIQDIIIELDPNAM